jgi:hypothetical protein
MFLGQKYICGMKNAYVFLLRKKVYIFLRKHMFFLDKYIYCMLVLIMRMKKEIKNLILAALLVITISGKGALIIEQNTDIKAFNKIERTI